MIVSLGRLSGTLRGSCGRHAFDLADIESNASATASASVVEGFSYTFRACAIDGVRILVHLRSYKLQTTGRKNISPARDFLLNSKIPEVALK
jgi:hypothetical protein